MTSWLNWQTTYMNGITVGHIAFCHVAKYYQMVLNLRCFKFLHCSICRGNERNSKADTDHKIRNVSFETSKQLQKLFFHLSIQLRVYYSNIFTFLLFIFISNSSCRRKTHGLWFHHGRFLHFAPHIFVPCKQQ
jgi:hypothetical protein